ncbi:2-keto-3-deoxygluconate permease [Clostridium sp. WLY-B-L2]|uniref:2-keto-3-deoxygluconate permease n=1 Tax=Clostridium aromativorans TaxID=2836848 RepID=A0ABS8N9Y9_9CLOT|nr:2-keto-3-deoxygluconate permease [Clostridium aromativorans]MCC9296623.1 2-keto-3-deoxygluconate permease [Clostridium aromativorans]
MKILKTVEKVPGGLMIIPLFLGAIINTCFPQIIKIGGITTATFSTGALVFIGCNLLCVGAQINLKGVAESLKRGTVLTIGKFLAGFIPAIIVVKMFGNDGIFGITPLLLLAAVTSDNCGIYLGLMSEIGDKYDLGAQALLGLTVGPLFTLLGLGVAGCGFNPIAIIASVGTMVVGFILGNLDEDIRNFLKSGIMFTLPFLGFSVGTGLNIVNIVRGGFTGILLGVLVIVLSFIFLVPADKFILRRPGYAAVANCSSASSSVAVPAIVAQSIPSLSGQVATATTAIAASAVITAILCPILTSVVVKKWGWAKNPIKENNIKNV